MPVRVMLADDHQILREGLSALLASQPDIEVVGEASDSMTAIRLAHELSPDVALMDINMGEPNGIEAARTIRAECPAVKIIALSVHGDEPFVSSMLKAGANAYVVKGSSFREVVEAIHVVMEGQTYLSPAVTGSLVDRAVRPATNGHPDGVRALSAREREVLRLLASGMSTKQTAHELSISVRTVETHRHHIMEKLEIDNLPGLTKYAIREGLSELTD
jgi:DNA-binding NarL/FixJ family response regulator